LWNGPDGEARMCYPVVATFQADYPESCLLTLVRVGQACPICLTSKEDFGSITTKEHQLRTVEAMKNVYMEASRLDKKAAENLLQANGMVNAKV
jgi:hypothetical protein